jgi:type II secretion system protein C
MAMAASREVLVHYVRPNPLYDGDLIKGYEVYSGPRSGIFSQLGLRNGDVIIALDDVPLSDPQQAIGMFEQLTDGTALVATLDRKGKRERVTLDGALIVADQQRVNEAPIHSAMSARSETIADR